MKYIVYGDDRVVLFDGTWNHWGVAQNLGIAPEQVLGAGRVRLLGGRLVCDGESITLGIDSRGRADAVVIEGSMKL